MGRIKGGARIESVPGREGEAGKASRDASAKETEAEANGLSGAIPDLFRRAMAVGLSGFFTTEETIRKALGDTLPQDWVDFATAQSERTRNEFMQRMSDEMGRVLEQVELAELLERLLEGRTIEVTAQIRLGERRSPAGEGDSPDGEAPTVRVEVAGGERSKE
jgi:hypothetical protein